MEFKSGHTERIVFRPLQHFLGGRTGIVIVLKGEHTHTQHDAAVTIPVGMVLAGDEQCLMYARNCVWTSAQKLWSLPNIPRV